MVLEEDVQQKQDNCFYGEWVEPVPGNVAFPTLLMLWLQEDQKNHYPSFLFGRYLL